MNQEQLKSLLRNLISTFGGGIAGFFVAKGWFTADQVMAVLNSPAFIGILVSAISFGWGLVTHTQSNAVAIVGAIAEQPGSPVKGVVTEPTVAGRELAASIPGPTVATAGTPEAAAIAKP